MALPVKNQKVVEETATYSSSTIEMMIHNLFKLNSKPSRSGLGLFATKDMLVRFHKDGDEVWDYALENAEHLGLRVEQSFRGDNYLLKICKI